MTEDQTIAYFKDLGWHLIKTTDLVRGLDPEMAQWTLLPPDMSAFYYAKDFPGVWQVWKVLVTMELAKQNDRY